MPRWSPTKYLEFAAERSRPFLDLLARVTIDPATVADLGCGPGHLTAVMRQRWPEAEILGVDSSPEMIAQAKELTDPHAGYLLADIATWAPEQPVDLIISNAAYQWVPEQLSLIPRLREHVAPAGALAFQVPHNFGGASHAVLLELASREPYTAHVADVAYPRGVDARTYLERLADPGWTLDVWETTYLHVLAGDDAVFHWMSGTGARPILQALPDGLRESFGEEYRTALRKAYPRQEFGTVLPFPRVFVVATRRS